MRGRGKRWAAFLAMCTAMEASDFELTVEEFAAFYAAFKHLLADGVRFDPAFVERVEALNRSARGTFDDSDDDISADDGQEEDDVHGDQADSDEIGGDLNTDPSPLHWWREIQAGRSRTLGRIDATETAEPERVAC